MMKHYFTGLLENVVQTRFPKLVERRGFIRYHNLHARPLQEAVKQKVNRLLDSS